jgi:hypothetical protein
VPIAVRTGSGSGTNNQRKTMSDKYDKAMAYLLRQKDFSTAVYAAWVGVDKERFCLFQFANNEQVTFRTGCLTQIYSRFARAQTKELTNRIQADNRIPGDVCEITRDNLHVFAEWQRIIDKELGRCKMTL